MGRGPGFDPERLHSIVPGATASPSAFMHPACTDGKRWVANPPLSTLYVDFESDILSCSQRQDSNLLNTVTGIF